MKTITFEVECENTFDALIPELARGLGEALGGRIPQRSEVREIFLGNLMEYAQRRADGMLILRGSVEVRLG